MTRRCTSHLARGPESHTFGNDRVCRQIPTHWASTIWEPEYDEELM